MTNEHTFVMRATTLVIMLVVGCTAGVNQSLWNDVGATCEVAVENAAAVDVRLRDLMLNTVSRYAPRRDVAFRTVADAEWDADSDLLYVLDGASRTVFAFDGQSAALLSTYGAPTTDEPPEPGRFSELPDRFQRNVLASIGEGRTVVKDLRAMHVFGDRIRTPVSERLDDVGAYRSITAIGPDMAIAALDGSTLMMEPEWSRRTRLTLTRIVFEDHSLTRIEVGWMGNHLRGRSPPREGGFPNYGSPYKPYYKRYLDGVSQARLWVTASQEVHGVCFFNETGTLLRSYRVNAPVITVDEDEKNAILSGQTNGPLPMLGVSPSIFHEEAWPQTVPRYVDVALSSDSTVWMQRLLGKGETVFDLFHFQDGYLGTVTPPWEQLPLTFRKACPIRASPRDDGFHVEQVCASW